MYSTQFKKKNRNTIYNMMERCCPNVFTWINIIFTTFKILCNTMSFTVKKDWHQITVSFIYNCVFILRCTAAFSHCKNMFIQLCRLSIYNLFNYYFLWMSCFSSNYTIFKPMHSRVYSKHVLSYRCAVREN